MCTVNYVVLRNINATTCPVTLIKQPGFVTSMQFSATTVPQHCLTPITTMGCMRAHMLIALRRDKFLVFICAHRGGMCVDGRTFRPCWASVSDPLWNSQRHPCRRHLSPSNGCYPPRVSITFESCVALTGCFTLSGLVCGACHRDTPPMGDVR